jgi:DNA polymerase-3 subunit epsilon
MREIIFDTETTGLDPFAGHRLVEIGCVELFNRLPTGKTYQTYINPERDMPAEAFAVHGLSEDFLRGQPSFPEVVDDFLAFIGESPLVIHNADFDMKFLNWELRNIGRPDVPRDRAIDTVAMARRRYPGSPANLDALCRRFGIDTSARDIHGALLDAQLLAQVYLELVGGREPGLELAAASTDGAASELRQGPARPVRPHAPLPEEIAAHEALLKRLTKPLWLAGE